MPSNWIKIEDIEQCICICWYCDTMFEAPANQLKGICDKCQSAVDRVFDDDIQRCLDGIQNDLYGDG